MNTKEIDRSQVLDLAKYCDEQYYEEDSDSEHYLYETVMLAVYGKDYFNGKEESRPE